MRPMKTFAIALVVLTNSSALVAEDSTEIAVVVNKANRIDSLSAAQIAALYKVRTTEFPDGTGARAVNLPPENPTRQEFDQVVLGLSPDESKRYWIDVKIRNGAMAPPRMATATSVARYVSKTPNAIGYVPRTSAYDLKVVARIRGGRVVSR